ncbi:phosphatidic acid phosphatase 1 [Striga asiatica]|uniref:Phosphatidic acid phosphatase 1 n=1 Tax=Striga asiatica TaxID=4170 RepID=A0A5A7QKP9_STRAF|nr:phosphatidic acid phosphatase 1 [Striga asiatica]
MNPHALSPNSDLDLPRLRHQWLNRPLDENQDRIRGYLTRRPAREFSWRLEMRDAIDGVFCGGSRAEADDHAGSDVLHGLGYGGEKGGRRGGGDHRSRRLGLVSYGHWCCQINKAKLQNLDRYIAYSGLKKKSGKMKDFYWRGAAFDWRYAGEWTCSNWGTISRRKACVAYAKQAHTGSEGERRRIYLFNKFNDS